MPQGGVRVGRVQISPGQLPALPAGRHQEEEAQGAGPTEPVLWEERELMRFCPGFSQDHGHLSPCAQ